MVLCLDLWPPTWYIMLVDGVAMVKTVLKKKTTITIAVNKVKKTIIRGNTDQLVGVRQKSNIYLYKLRIVKFLAVLDVPDVLDVPI